MSHEPVSSLDAKIDMDPALIAVDNLGARIDHLTARFDQFSRDMVDRQDRAHRGQWPLVVASAGVLVAFGALVTTVLVAVGGIVAYNITRENDRAEREILALREDVEVWGERVAGVAATANSAAAGASDAQRRIEKQIDAQDKEHRSLNYRVSKLESEKE